MIMQEEQKKEEEFMQETETQEVEEKEQKEEEAVTKEVDELKNSLAELNDKYIRLYADFENYKKLVAREKEELIKYSNEALMSDFLTVIDHLELALQHAQGNEGSSALAEGVELTLKELKNTLKKHGLVSIEALGKPFDPNLHHALSQIETEDTEEGIVVTEFRKGYMLKDRVLRAALVGVSKRPSKQTQIVESKENKGEE
jgi:molecular chaperone GrpE